LAVKSPGLTGRVQSRLSDWRAAEERGIPGGVVKCVEIRRNTRGESGALGRT
jgi:hypothetical protein